MAINRFSKKNILTDSKNPIDHAQIYDDVNLNKLDVLNLPLNNTNFSSNSKTDFHVYSEDNRIFSSRYPLNYEINNGDLISDYNIIIKPERDVRQSGVESGNYNIVYNFLEPKVSNIDIDNISADGTEIQLSISNDVDSEKLKNLFDLINDTSTFKKEFVLNFGDNQLEPIVGIYFDNNKRVGEIVRDLEFPIASFNQQPTRFYPTDDGKWVEVTLPNSGSYITTGRTANFKSEINGNVIGWNQELDGNDNPIFYTHDAQFEDRLSTIEPNINLTDELIGNPTYANIRYFDNSLANVNGLTNIVVKLYRGLSSGLETEIPSLDLVLRDSYIERILVYPTDIIEVHNDFSPPDFTLDLGYYGKSQGTNLKSWNDLLDTNQQTANQIVSSNFSSSFGNIKLNVNYTDFQNFVKYSSAVERVNNFHYKLQLIENYNSRINTLNNVSGSDAITNISQSMMRRDNLLGGMDGWENWMYYQSSGSLYTHYSSSAFTFEPWPKKPSDPLTYPLSLYETTSSNAENYLSGLLESASYYDSINDSMLTKVTPTSIVEDDLNEDYLLFLNMIGEYFDIVWTYVKSLTAINSREEHPFDGMPDDLLYNVASSMGWELTHTKQRGDLWGYFIGTDRQGNALQSGSLESKSEKQMNSEVWRRIVNNIPYLLKTKGTRRSVKALISTYGIPQSFLSIREYGGPVIDETETQLYWEHDKFVYHLNFDGNNSLSTPWGDIATLNGNDYSFNEYKVPDAIELQFQQNQNDTVNLINKEVDFAVVLEPTASSTLNGNIHFYLNGGAGYKSASIFNVPVFDNKMSTLVIQREISTNDISDDNLYSLIYKRSFRDQITLDRSASIAIDGSVESSYNANWTSSGDLWVSSGSLPSVSTPSNWANSDYLNGAIQELRLWENALIDGVIEDHTLARNMYNGNTHTSSYFDLKMRFIPDSQLKTASGTVGIKSEHPNQLISTTQDGRVLSASLFNIESDDLIGVTEEYYTRIPSAGANNIMTNKVRIDANQLLKPLDIDNRSEVSLYDKAPVDTNQVGVYLSATQTYDEDIYNHTGFFKVDDYIGNPDSRTGHSETHRELDYLRRQVFKKYSTKNLINAIIDILSRYDLTVFDQIRQTMPARVDYNSGILIEPHILERPKFRSTSDISHEDLVHSTTLKQIDKPIESAFVQLETSFSADYSLLSDFKKLETTVDLVSDNPIISTRADVLDCGVISVVNPYDMATYEYTHLIYSQSADLGFGLNWTTSSNGYWNYNPIGTAITLSRVSKYALSQVFFYETDESASFDISFSSSFIPSMVSTDNLPLGYENSKWNGCKMTSDSISTNSPDTPDGLPVIEVFTADPNVLIYTSATAKEGNLNIGTDTTISTLMLDDLYVSKYIEYQKSKEYRSELREFRRSISELQNLEDARLSEFEIMIQSQMNRETEENVIRTSLDYFISD
jgi:hypothetical protein